MHRAISFGLIIITLLCAFDLPAANAATEVEAQSCTDKTKNAGLACATMSTVTGMDAGTSAMVEMIVVSQLPSLIAQLTSGGKSAAEQCKIQEKANQLVGVVTAAKTAACVATGGSCSSTCSKDYASVDSEIQSTEKELVAAKAASSPSVASIEEELARLRKARQEIADQQKKCSAYKSNVGLMLAQAGITAVNMVQAGQCADDLSSSSALDESTADCSNSAYAATNLVCICRNTPSDAMCTNSNSGSGGAGSGGTIASSTTPGLATDEEDPDEIEAPPKFDGTEGTNEIKNSGGGGGLPGSNGPGAIAGEREGVEGSDIDKNVITGTSGSSGMAGLSSPGNGSGGKGGGSGTFGDGSGGFDFKKYLPKSLFKNRGLVGMTVPSTDGMTGPMGPTLWEKVTTRYQAKKSSLFQDK